MDEINQRVDQAHRRLLIEQWLGRAVWCVFLGLCVGLAGVAAPKLFVTPELPTWWNAAWLGGGAGLGLVSALVWSLATRLDRNEAAVEIDRRYGLRERVASSLSLDEQTLQTEAGRALAEDAERAVREVEVSERFGMSFGKRAWLPLAPAAAALLLVAFVGNRAAESSPDPAPGQVTAEEVKKAVEEARKRLERRKQQAEKKGLTDASGLLKEIEKSTEELAKKTPSQTSKAAVKLNDLAKQLDERRKKLGGGESLREQLNRMKDLGQGPADKAANAMKQGDWQKALEEISKLQEKLAKGDMTKEEQEKLAKQLGKLGQKLADAAKKQQEQKKELERQLADAQRKGDLQQASKLQEKLDQLAAKAPQMQQMQKLAQQCQQCQNAMQQGDGAKAAEAMQQMANQMQQLQQQAEAMEMLDGAMTDIQMAKEAMGLCNKPGNPMAQGAGQGQKQGKPGRGMGEGRGEGPRPDEKNPTAFRDTQVKQNVGRGASTFGGLVKGPSVKGEVTESIKQDLTSEAAQPADPLTSERLPRAHREHAEEYFRQLREEL